MSLVLGIFEVSDRTGLPRSSIYSKFGPATPIKLGARSIKHSSNQRNQWVDDQISISIRDHKEKMTLGGAAVSFLTNMRFLYSHVDKISRH